MKALILALVALVAVACGSQSSGEGSASWVSLEAGDGAKVELEMLESDTGQTGSFAKVAEATGEVAEDRKNVSAQYELTLPSLAAVTSNVTVTVPLAEQFLTAGFPVAALQPEVFDQTSQQWKPTGSLVVYDSKGQTLTFDISALGKVEYELPVIPEGISTKPAALEDGQFTGKYRVGLYLFSDAVRVERPGSSFAIMYYPSELKKPYSVKDDGAWNSTSGNATDKEVPDFVEDLDAALNGAYDALLELDTSSGKLFSALPLPQVVYITDTGEGAGESPLGGPMKMSNSRIESWTDLRGVTAHELIHVLQGRYYTGGTAGNVINWAFTQNRWYIEATANFLGAKVSNYSAEEQHSFYTKDGDANYLSFSLLSSDNNSMYTAAHFLSWIADTYGLPAVGDVMQSGDNAIAALSSSLRNAGEESGLSGAFLKYGRYVATMPDDMDGMNRSILVKLTNYNIANGYINRTMFTDKRPFVSLTRPVKPLSMVYFEVQSKNTDSGLLVLDNVAAKGASLEYTTWNIIGTSNTSFSGLMPIDDYQGKPLTVKDFGANGTYKGFTQLIVNNNFLTTFNIKHAYYVLTAPKVTEVVAGSVTWDTSVYADFPAGQLSGFAIFKDLGEGCLRLGTASYQNGQTLSFKSSDITAGDTIIVQVMDKFDHAWPEVVEAEIEEPSEDTVDPVKHPACANTPEGSDSCYNDSCYNCCVDCEEGAVLIYECMSGCYVYDGEMGGETVQFCDCN